MGAPSNPDMASYQIRKIVGCVCTGNAGNVPPPTSKETASWGSWHASRHVRHARVVMHVGIAYPRWRGNVPDTPGACVTRNLTYLVRGPCFVLADTSEDQNPHQIIQHLARSFPSQNITLFPSDIHFSVKNYCCCTLTVRNSYVNFTN